MMRPAATAVAVALLVVTAACAAGPARPVASPSVEAPASSSVTTIPFTMQPAITDLGILAVDHITVDDQGAYVCVLRRGNDLASLRAQYIVRDG